MILLPMTSPGLTMPDQQKPIAMPVQSMPPTPEIPQLLAMPKSLSTSMLPMSMTPIAPADRRMSPMMMLPTMPPNLASSPPTENQVYIHVKYSYIIKLLIQSYKVLENICNIIIHQY